MGKTLKRLLRILRWTILTAFVLLGIIFVGLLIIQNYFSSFLQNYVRTELGWSLKIGSAEIQFKQLSVRLESIELSAENNKPFFHAKSASANLPYAAFWGDEFVMHEIVLDSPKLNLDLLPLRSQKGSDAQGKKFRIENAIVRSGELTFDKHEWKNINLISQIDSTGMRIQKIESNFNDINLEAQGSCKDWNKMSLDVSYQARGDATRIAAMVPSIGSWTGPFETGGNVQGEIKNAVVSGKLKSAQMIFDHGPPFALDAEYKYKFGDEAQPLSVTANVQSFSMDVLRNRWSQMPQISSVGNGTLQYSGGSDFWKGSGSLNLNLATGNNKGLPVAGNIFATLRNGSVEIHPSNLQLSGSQLKANGTLWKNDLSLNTDFQTARLKDIVFLSPKFANIPGNYHVKAQLSGSYQDINVDGILSGNSGSSVIQAKGKTRTGSKVISAQFQGNASLDLLKAVLPEFKTGEVQYEGSIEGTWKNPIVTASMNASAIQIRNVKLQQLSTQITTEKSNLMFHTEAPELQLQANGSFALNSRTYKLQGKIDGTDAKTLLAFFKEEIIPVQGKVYADFESAGSIDRWKQSSGSLQLRMPEAQWKDVQFQIPETEIQLDKGVADVKGRILSANAEMNLNGTAALRPHFPMDLQIDGKFNGGLLKKISKDWTGEGELNFNGTIQGDTSHPEVQGKVVTENFHANYLPNGSKILLSKAEVSLSEEKLNLIGKGSLNDSPISLSGSLPLKNDDGDLHVEISNLPVGSLSQSAKVSGNLNITGDFQGRGFPFRSQLPFNEWSGNLSINPTDLKLGKNDITVEQPLLVRIEKGMLYLSEASIRSGDLLNFKGSGNLNLDTGQIDSQAHLEARIDLLSSLKADIQSSGPLVLDARVVGTIKNPEYSGKIQLTNASIRIPESPLILENLDLQASLDAKGLKLDKLQARSGGGVITGGGELVRKRKGSEVWFQGKNVAANYPEGLRSQLDFDLKLSALESAVLLSGDVHVLRSFYEQEITPWNPIVRKLLATTKKLTAEKELENKLKLAVNINTVQDFRFRNNSAILRAGGNLKIDGSLYRPKLSGLLSIREGSRVFISGNQYDVEKANVEFFQSESIEPNFDIVLSSLLRDFQTDTYYEVFVPFGGTPSNIEFKNVRSTPSLSQDQIFSLLTDGTVESTQAGSSGVFQKQLLSFFAGQTLGVPTATIAKSIGLSRIKVQQEGLNSVNDPKTRLMLGKDIGAGFSLIYSFVLNDPDEQTWIATYRYGRNIIGRFIDQDDDTYTVSVSHKIPFGKGVKPGSFSYDSRKKDRGSRITGIELKNVSPLTDKEISDVLKTEVGDFYDYWSFQDRADELKKELQKLNYLYPAVDVRENERASNSVVLEIEVHSGEPSEMIFNGFEVSEKLMNRYKRMWRTGISAIVVQQMIREDLLRELQLSGYHQASVNSTIVQSGTGTIYSFDVTPGPQFKSVELKFLGAENYAAQALQKDVSELYQSPDELFREAIHKPSSFCEKIKMLYAQAGYLKSTVQPGSIEFSVETGMITRVIRVQEGSISQIDALTVSGAQHFPDTLEAQLQLHEGLPFLPDGLFEDENTIRRYYEASGHESVSVHYNIEFEKNSSNLLLQWVLKTGPLVKIASIRIEGNQTTRSDVILNQIKFKEGEVLTHEDRSLAKKRLSDLGVFQQSEIEVEETDVPGMYDVVVRVTENKRYEFQYGGRYNTDDKAGVELRLSDFNFLGRAQSLSLYGRSTLDLPLFRVDYILPVTGSFWDRTRFTIFRDETDEDVRATVSGDLIKIPFTHRQLTAQFQQDYRLWTNYRLIWGFEYGKQTAEFENLNGVPREFRGTEALFRSAFVADRRDDPLNASRGFFFSINGEYAPTLFGSDISYAKNFSQIFYYKKIGKFVSASGVRAGFLKLRSNILTIAEKFRTGGSTTIRGFVHNTVVPGDDPISIFFGGDSVFIVNEEIRFPLYKWLSGAVFYDAGNVYLLASDFDPTDLRHSAGFGFRVGGGGFVLRFDLGFNLNPEEGEDQSVFHFGIGQAF